MAGLLNNTVPTSAATTAPPLTSTYANNNPVNLNLQGQDVLNMGLPQTSVDAMAQAGSKQLAGVQATPTNLTKNLGATNQEFSTASDAARQGNALGGPDNTSAVINAISQRNLKRNNDYVNNLTSSIQLQAPALEAQGMAQNLSNLSAQASVLTNNYQIQQQYALDQRQVQLFAQQQQDSILAGILGVVGVIGGAVLGAATGGAGYAAAGAVAGGAAAKGGK